MNPNPTPTGMIFNHYPPAKRMLRDILSNEWILEQGLFDKLAYKQIFQSSMRTIDELLKDGAIIHMKKKFLVTWKSSPARLRKTNSSVLLSFRFSYEFPVGYVLIQGTDQEIDKYPLYVSIYANKGTIE